MPDGYKGQGKIDEQWWLAQIKMGEDFRRLYAREDSWPRWREYYRGNWADGVLPKNIFFSMLRSIVPRVYFRNPQVSIRAAEPGFLNMAFAQLMNRIVNKVAKETGLKEQMKDTVHDIWLKGSGGQKIGYGALFSGSPSASDEGQPAKKGELFEYDPQVFPGMPYARRVDPGRMVFPTGTRRQNEARWIAEEVERPKDDLLRDPRLKNVNGLVATHTRGARKTTLEPDTEQDMVKLYEVRDKKFKRVFLIAPTAGSDHSGTGRVLLDIEGDAMQARDIPYRTAVFNPDDEVIWGIPFSQILEPQQLEINETRTQQMKHRRALLIKLLVKRHAILPEEADKMLSEDVSAVVWTEEPPQTSIDKVQTSNIPQDLSLAESAIMTDVRDTMGFSRNELGEFQTRRGDTSAEEARNVHASSEIRLDEMRDAMADMLEAIISEWIELIFDFWTTEMVIDVVGPGGVPIWVKVNPSELRMGSYKINIDPESASPINRVEREARALQRYQFLKENPFVDPQKLTRFVLMEMEGVEMDDLLRQLPPAQGGQNGAVNPQQFAGILQQGFQGGQSAGIPPGLLG